jgi:hypothetical protein
LNPDFKTTIDLDFFFEREQLLRFEFIDDDGGDDGQPFYDIIGVNTLALSTIMASRGQTVTRALVHPTKADKARGMMIVKAQSKSRTIKFVSSSSRKTFVTKCPIVVA